MERTPYVVPYNENIDKVPDKGPGDRPSDKVMERSAACAIIFDYGSVCMADKERIADSAKRARVTIVPAGVFQGNGGEGDGQLPEQSGTRHGRWRSGVRPYVLVVGVVGAATALRWILDPLFGPAKQFITFYPAIVVAALVGGARAGVMATVLAAVAVDQLFVRPRGGLLTLRLSDWVALVLFGTAGGLISWMAEKVDRARRQEAEGLERKRAAEALRANERLHRALGESIQYGIWICDPQGRNTYVSESFLKLLECLSPPLPFGICFRSSPHRSTARAWMRSAILRRSVSFDCRA